MIAILRSAHEEVGGDMSAGDELGADGRNPFDLPRRSRWERLRRAGAMLTVLAAAPLVAITAVPGPSERIEVISSGAPAAAPAAAMQVEGFDRKSGSTTQPLNAGARPAAVEVDVEGGGDGDEPEAETTTTTAAPTTTTTIWVEPTVEPEGEWVDAGHGVRVPDLLLRIRYCESTNYYQSRHRVSSASGAYQFLTRSWQWYGHASRYGVAAAADATPAQQDEAALLTWRRDGARPWAESRRCWANPNLTANYATAVPRTTTTAALTTSTTEAEASDGASSSTTSATGSGSSTSSESTTSTADPASSTTSSSSSASSTTSPPGSSSTTSSTGSTTSQPASTGTTSAGNGESAAAMNNG